MNKPLTMIINETKNNLAEVCNKSQLPISILDLIIQGLYSEIHSIAEKQAIEDARSYAEELKEEKQGSE